MSHKLLHCVHQGESTFGYLVLVVSYFSLSLLLLMKLLIFPNSQICQSVFSQPPSEGQMRVYCIYLQLEQKS